MRPGGDAGGVIRPRLLRLAVLALLVAASSLGCYTSVRWPDPSPYRPRATSREAVPDTSAAVPPPQIEVTTSGVEYVKPAYEDIEITVIVRHRGGRSVWLVGCPDPPQVYLDEWTGGDWENGSHYYDLSMGEYPVHRDELLLSAGDVVTQKVAVRSTGRYRARLFVGRDINRPEFEVVSDEFVVRR